MNRQRYIEQGKQRKPASIAGFFSCVRRHVMIIQVVLCEILADVVSIGPSGHVMAKREAKMVCGMRVRLIRWIAVALLACSMMSRAADISLANLQCPDSGLLSAKMVTGVCWDGIFPIRVMGATIYSSSNWAPDDVSSKPLCWCKGTDTSVGVIGFPMGLWMPTRAIEVTRHPYCVPGLGGVKIAADVSSAGAELYVGGSHTQHGDDTDKAGASESTTASYHVKYFYYPLATMLELFDVPKCNPDGAIDIDLVSMSEAYPNWFNNELALLIQPDTLLYASPVGTAAVPIDCAKLWATDKPIKELYWAAGCWGKIFPSIGTNNTDDSPVTTTSLLATRYLSMLARTGMLKKSIGSDQLCDPENMWVLNKQQYKMQAFFPSSEASGTSLPSSETDTNGIVTVNPDSLMSGSCTHGLGSSSLKWGEWRGQPGTGEDHSYILWQWVDCCSGVIGF